MAQMAQEPCGKRLRQVPNHQLLIPLCQGKSHGDPHLFWGETQWVLGH